ncbi:MAG: glycosyltransferase family 4 protein [Acidimicrobiia bacterium]
MRLLLDVSAVPARPVGAGVYIVNLAHGLDRRDEVDLHLLTRRDDVNRWRGLAPTATVHAEVPLRRPLRLAWEQSRAPSLAKRIGVDLWHGPHYTLPMRLDVPSVVSVLDLTFFDHPEWHERTKVMFFRRMIPASLRRARAAIAISDFTARRLEAVLDPDLPVVVAPLGVDLERFRPAPHGDRADLDGLAHLGITPPYLAFAATLEPRKNAPALIAAFARLAPKWPDLQLVVAGRDGWGATTVRDAAAASGVTTRILRPGWFPGESLPAFFRQSAAVVYPSLEEGFGLPALEALACGAPLVTTTGSAMEEVVGEAALLVPPGDVDALTAALGELLDDEPRAERLRAAGPPQAAPFTWEACIDQHLVAYRLASGVRA